jgi:hypothetical protein
MATTSQDKSTAGSSLPPTGTAWGGRAKTASNSNDVSQRASTTGDSRGALAGEPEALLSLDFLPGEYRERRAIKKTRLWQLTIILLFGGVVAATSVMQFGLRCAAQRRVQSIAALHAQAQTRTQHLEQLQQQLQVADRTADLYVYLKHPWPRTQILRATVSSLPASIRLEELQIVREPAAQDTATRPGQPLSEETSDQEEEDPEQLEPESDLGELRDECDQMLTVVRLSGITRNAADLHTYLANVVKSPLIHEAELRSLESAAERRQSRASRFAVRLVVVPGFGQPDGPKGPSPVHTDLAGTSTAHEETGG